MAWHDARLALLDVLDDLGEITVRRRGHSDSTVRVARVYEHPPAAVNDHPAIIAAPPATTVERAASRRREETLTQSLAIVVHDSNPDQAAAIADAIRQAVVERFDTATRLGGHADWIEGPDFDELAGEQRGELHVAVYSGELRIHINSEVAERSA